VASVGPAATRPHDHRLADLVRLQALRLKVFFRRAQLDEELASGLDHESEPALALPASQPVRIRYRKRLARIIERLIYQVDRDRYGFSPAVRFRHVRVKEARAVLPELAIALRTAAHLRPRCAAMFLMLLEDPASSHYAGSPRGTLQLQALAILECLLGERQANWDASHSLSLSIRGGLLGIG
jgi:hypothetical protein